MGNIEEESRGEDALDAVVVVVFSSPLDGGASQLRAACGASAEIAGTGAASARSGAEDDTTDGGSGREEGFSFSYGDTVASRSGMEPSGCTWDAVSECGSNCSLSKDQGQSGLSSNAIVTLTLSPSPTPTQPPASHHQRPLAYAGLSVCWPGARTHSS